MVDEKINFGGAATGRSAGRADTKQERSTISFPYHDLDAGTAMARAVYNRNGLGSCDLDELAAEMGQTVSGAFRLKTGSARIYGFVDKEGRGAFRLTPLGQRLVSSDGEAAARADAFLSVPLYRAVYDQYKGHLLPPAKALEREMQALGVSSKQTDKARQVFERSARQAGFFDAGDDRLVRPRLETSTTGEANTLDQALADRTESQTGAEAKRPRSGGGGEGYHPFIQGLLQTLPEPETVWTVEGRAAWLQAAANCFNLIYKGEGKVTVHAEPTKVSDADTA